MKNVVKARKKPATVIPPRGRKMSVPEAVEHVNRKFGKALARLAK